jgi:hypothetical protein
MNTVQVPTVFHSVYLNSRKEQKIFMNVLNKMLTLYLMNFKLSCIEMLKGALFRSSISTLKVQKKTGYRPIKNIV